MPTHEPVEFTPFMRFHRAFGRSNEPLPGTPELKTTPPRKLGHIERIIVAPIIFMARMVALFVALTIWIFPIGPVWVAILMRTIAVFSVATVRSLFTGQDPPDEQRLNYVSAFWLSGFFQILNTFVNRAPLHEIFLRPSQWYPIEELIIACLFYLWMLTSIAFLHHWITFLNIVVALLWTVILAVYHFAVWAVQTLYQHL